MKEARDRKYVGCNGNLRGQDPFPCDRCPSEPLLGEALVADSIAKISLVGCFGRLQERSLNESKFSADISRMKETSTNSTGRGEWK